MVSRQKLTLPECGKAKAGPGPRLWFRAKAIFPPRYKESLNCGAASSQEKATSDWQNFAGT
jgi:hypothetical protein